MGYGLRARKAAVAWNPGAEGESLSAINFPATINSFQPLNYDMIERPTGYGQYMPQGKFPGAKWMVIDFTVEWRGAGATALANDRGPTWAALMRACGYNETFSGATTTKGVKLVTGNPHFNDDEVAGDTDPVDITFYIDTRKIVATNCVGNAVMTWAAGKIPTINFQMVGQFSEVESEVATQTVSAAYVDAAPAPWVNASLGISNSNEDTIGDAKVNQIVVDTGAQILTRRSADDTYGIAIPRIADFALTATFDIETEDLDSWNWETNLNSNYAIRVKWAHQGGTGTGDDGVGCDFAINGYLSSIPGRANNSGILDDNVVLDLSDTAAAAVGDEVDAITIEFASTS